MHSHSLSFKTADPQYRPHAVYFLWLFTTLNLLSGAGYFLFSGAVGIGDWADVVRDTMPPVVWRPTMSVFGGALYFLLARQSAQWLRSRAGSGEFSIRRSKRLSGRQRDQGGSEPIRRRILSPLSTRLLPTGLS